MTSLKLYSNHDIFIIAVFVIFIITSCHANGNTDSNTSDSTALIPISSPDTAIVSPNKEISYSSESNPAPDMQEGSTGFREASNVIESNIDGDFKGFDDHKIFKLANGQIWQQDESKHIQSYKYRPGVSIIYSGGNYKMYVDEMNDPIKVKLLNGQVGKNENNQSAADVIETYITSGFDGFNYGNIYKLANGQIWEQTEPYIYLYIFIRPKVTIYKTEGAYKLKFDNIDHAVTVRQIN